MCILLACLSRKLTKSKDWCVFILILSQCLSSAWIADVFPIFYEWVIKKWYFFLSHQGWVFHLGKTAFPSYNETEMFLISSFLPTGILFFSLIHETGWSSSVFSVLRIFLTSRFMEKSLTLRLWTCEKDDCTVNLPVFTQGYISGSFLTRPQAL